MDTLFDNCNFVVIIGITVFNFVSEYMKSWASTLFSILWHFFWPQHFPQHKLTDKTFLVLGGLEDTWYEILSIKCYLRVTDVSVPLPLPQQRMTAWKVHGMFYPQKTCLTQGTKPAVRLVHHAFIQSLLNWVRSGAWCTEALWSLNQGIFLMLAMVWNVFENIDFARLFGSTWRWMKPLPCTATLQRDTFLGKVKHAPVSCSSACGCARTELDEHFDQYVFNYDVSYLHLLFFLFCSVLWMNESWLSVNFE